MVDRVSGNAIGHIEIIRVPDSIRAYGAFAISPDMNRQGAEESAVQALATAAKDTLGIGSLLAEVRVDNAPLRTLYERMGWRLVGILDDHVMDAAGIRHDVALMQRVLEVRA